MILCPKCNEAVSSFPTESCKCASSRQLLRLAQIVVNSTMKLPRFFIPLPDGQSPYLERFVLEVRPDGGKTYLHVIYASDGDRDPHDHPWDFESEIIWGRYEETVYYFKCPSGCGGTKADGQGTTCYCGRQTVLVAGPTERFGAGAFNKKRAAQLHRLTLVNGPVVTLVTRGPKKRDWGFQTPEGWEIAESYIRRKFPGAQPTEVD